MNTGTQAAKEAGNMIDLDSNPTKLIEVVQIGKQLLMTRGALTTFSIANDVAKYFAILPAIFGAYYIASGESRGALWALNVMGLHSAHSAILAAVIFNAVIIIALIPLALRGVSYQAMNAETLLRRNLLILRCRWPDCALPRYLAHRPTARHLQAGSSQLICNLRTKIMLKLFVSAIRATFVITLLTGLAFPFLITGLAQVFFSGQAHGSLISNASGKIVGSSLIAQSFTRPQYFHPRPSAAGSAGFAGEASGGTNLGRHRPN